MSVNEVPEATARTWNLPPPFQCTARDGHGATWIHVAGELDVASAPELEKTLRRYVRSRLIVLDLRDLEFMETAGVHVILDASNAARQAQGRFVLISTPGVVDDVFALTQVADQLEIVDLQRGTPAVQVLLQPTRQAS